MRVAIMQPTYLPWAGYFGLIDSVDLFIFLDNVQFDRRSWQQRNRIKTNAGVRWLSVPVYSKGKRDQRINEVIIDNSTNFIEVQKKTIRHNYRAARFFSDGISSVESLIDDLQSEILSDYTIEIIRKIMLQLNIGTQTVRASELTSTGVKAELLASLCDEVGARVYLSPPGSKEYLEGSDSFEKAGIPVQYFNFVHPTYSQPHGEFISHLSVVDLLLNCGPKCSELISRASGTVEI